MLKDFKFKDIIVNNETYLKLNKDIYSLLHKIEKHIPIEQLFLLETLEDLYNKQEGLAEELSYIQGIKDCKNKSFV